MAEELLAELKARCDDLDGARARLQALGAAHETTRAQCDTYFAASRGRLKLREVHGLPAQLIAYERPDVADVKTSRIRLAPVADGPALGAALEAALGVRQQVRKRREIWRWEGVQVHLDVVEGLGTFVELEESVAEPSGLPEAAAHLRRMLADLGLGPSDLLAVSYAELLARP